MGLQKPATRPALVLAQQAEGHLQSMLDKLRGDAELPGEGFECLLFATDAEAALEDAAVPRPQTQRIQGPAYRLLLGYRIQFFEQTFRGILEQRRATGSGAPLSL